jgi:hypothetical protein
MSSPNYTLTIQTNGSPSQTHEVVPLMQAYLFKINIYFKYTPYVCIHTSIHTVRSTAYVYPDTAVVNVQIKSNSPPF